MFTKLVRQIKTNGKTIMKDKKQIYGYDRLELQVAHNEYNKASKWIDLLMYVLGILLGALAYKLIW